MPGASSRRKRNSSRAAILFFAFASIVFAAPLSGTPADIDQRLRATIEIEGLKTCHDAGTRTYRFSGNARLRVANVGARYLIISREINVPDFQYSIARDAKSLAAGVFEYRPYIYRTIEVVKVPCLLPCVEPGEAYFARLIAEEKDVPSALSWIVLAPGDSFLSDAFSFGIDGISVDDSAKFPYGSHVVQFRINTWNVPEKSAEETCQKWNWFGDCLRIQIKTEPAPFVVSADPNMPDCK